MPGALTTVPFHQFGHECSDQVGALPMQQVLSQRAHMPRVPLPHRRHNGRHHALRHRSVVPCSVCRGGCDHGRHWEVGG